MGFFKYCYSASSFLDVTLYTLYKLQTALHETGFKENEWLLKQKNILFSF